MLLASFNAYCNSCLCTNCAGLCVPSSYINLQESSDNLSCEVYSLVCKLPCFFGQTPRLLFLFAAHLCVGTI